MLGFRAAARKLLQLGDSPESIAWGVAVGWVVGMTPPVWPQSVGAFLIAWGVRCNRIAAMMATWFTNPLTYPIYLFNYWVGRVFCRVCTHKAFLTPSEVKDKIRLAVEREPGEWNFYRIFSVGRSSLRIMGEEVLWPMLIGGAIVSLALAPLVYWGTAKAVRRYRQRHPVSVS